MNKAIVLTLCTLFTCVFNSCSNDNASGWRPSSVDDLFAWIDTMKAHHSPKDSLVVTYDSRFGFPAKLEYCKLDALDGDFTIVTWNLLRIL